MSNSSEELFNDLSLQAGAPIGGSASFAPGDDIGAATAISESPAETLERLKNRARVLGIQFSNNIGVDALRARIEAKLDGTTTETTAPVVDPAKPEAQVSARTKMIREQMRLVRCRITNLNPNKKALPGEIFTFANRVLGTVRKYIPYGEATDNGYHIPYCIYQQLKEREFLDIKVTKDSRRREVITTRMAREFAIELLDPLTPKELAALAAQQAAAKGQD